MEEVGDMGNDQNEDKKEIPWFFPGRVKITGSPFIVSLYCLLSPAQ